MRIDSSQYSRLMHTDLAKPIECLLTGMRNVCLSDARDTVIDPDEIPDSILDFSAFFDGECRLFLPFVPWIGLEIQFSDGHEEYRDAMSADDNFLIYTVDRILWDARGFFTIGGNFNWQYKLEIVEGLSAFLADYSDSGWSWTYHYCGANEFSEADIIRQWPGVLKRIKERQARWVEYIDSQPFHLGVSHQRENFDKNRLWT